MVMMLKNRPHKVKRVLSLVFTVLMCVTLVVILFVSFCIIEATVMLFTGGTFSMLFPAIATVAILFALIALAIVSGGAA